MSCEKCKNIITKLNLEKERYASTTVDDWHNLIHDDLLSYADYNNGVSEGGTGYACKTCFTFFEDHYHISMDEDEIGVQLVDDVHDADIRTLAHYIVIDEQAEEIKKSLQKKERIKVYAKSDLYVPHTFNYGREDEKSYMVLEMHQKFGFNHEIYSNYPSIDLTLEGLIRNVGTNDEYAKKTFFLCFEVNIEHIHVYPLSSPYADASVMIAIDEYIKPKDIRFLNPETMEEIPLVEVSLEECKNRNHDEFLKTIREKQNQLTKNDSSLDINEKVQEKITFILNNKK